MQGRFDGLEIDSYQGRFTGTFDLDQEDINALELDRVAFFVVAVRVEGATLKTTTEADVKRTNILKVQDARVARDQLRLDAVQWLAGKNGQGTLEFQQRNGLASDEERAEEEAFITVSDSPPIGLVVSGSDPPVGLVIDTETGEMLSTDVDENVLEEDLAAAGSSDPVSTDVEVVAPPYVSPASQGPEKMSMPVDRPGVAKFDPAAFDGPADAVRVGQVEQVGSVYGDRKDTRLKKFMESGE